MKIAIGVMLWNEEDSIGLTIDSLFRQSLFRENFDQVESIQVVALANGCTDNSVPRAKAAFARCSNSGLKNSAQWEVLELAEPGRSNAWNQFVHEYVGEDIDYIFFMDADIEIDKPRTLENMVLGLETYPRSHVAAALGVKDVELKSSKSLWERLTLKVTELKRSARLTFVCGGLYAGRAKFFKELYFPQGFVCGDDAYIMSMAISNLQTTDLEFDRIIHPEEARFVFEAYTQPKKLFNQNVRREIGAAVREILISDVAVESKREGVGFSSFIIAQSKQQPDWFLQVLERRLREKGFWVIPCKSLFIHFKQASGKSLGYRIANFPLVCAATVWRCLVLLEANRRFARRTFSKAWKNNPNIRMTSSVARPSAETAASK